jgi:hypothetical protein
MPDLRASLFRQDMSEPHRCPKATAIAGLIKLRRTPMTPFIALYFALPAIFTTAVTLRNVIFGDVV